MTHAYNDTVIIDGLIMNLESDFRNMPFA